MDDMDSESALVFVYGTLMRGEDNHAQMEGASYVGEAHTVEPWRLYRLDGYPGAVRAPEGDSVAGELWRVSPGHLARLDAFEGVHEGLYRRVRGLVNVANREVEVWIYEYARSTEGRVHLKGWRA